ncbi:MAG: hypothetical protein JWP02_3087, partial [Acidimicrobiales bacterium]|nr:hypothetical protein [Acidimicrobiales bacterium]
AHVIAGAALIVLLLFFFVIRPILFKGGGGGGTTAKPPLARPQVTTTTRPTAGGPSESFEIFNTKNPFTPLVNPAGSGATTGTTVAGGGGTTGTTFPSGGATATTAAGGSGASGGAATAPRQSQRVALLNVYPAGGRTVADVRVNDTVYTRLAPGATFASTYKVVSLQGSCGTFLFGDESFRLCKGEEVLK